VTSYLEVLDTERSLFNAKLEASRTLQLSYAAIVDLFAALGGGWDPDEVPTLPESKIPNGKDDEGE
jgi:multidrug efflux system outer membrane protein